MCSLKINDFVENIQRTCRLFGHDRQKMVDFFDKCGFFLTETSTFFTKIGGPLKRRPVAASVPQNVVPVAASVPQNVVPVAASVPQNVAPVAASVP